jgi:hypothetical protein
VRVGHRQALILKSPTVHSAGDFFCLEENKITDDLLL